MNKQKKPLSVRMKEYEAASETRLYPNTPVATVRLDGKKFSSFCKRFEKPFDLDYRQIMVDLTKHLVETYHADIGYTQSDEITLIFTPSKTNEFIFDGRSQKSCSVFASDAAGFFIFELLDRIPDKSKLQKHKLPKFDCRIAGLPSKMEGYNNLLWRQYDAEKNSISMLADKYFSPDQMKGVNGKEKQYKLITEKNINWNDLDSNFKRGTFVQCIKVWKELDAETLARIPENKRPANNRVQRSKTVALDIPNIGEVENAIDFIFNKAEPIFKELKDKTQIK